MKLTKAIIPMAGPAHRDLPLQHVTTGDGRTKRVAALQIEELIAAGIREVALVTPPGTHRNPGNPAPCRAAGDLVG